jgi:Smg protein
LLYEKIIEIIVFLLSELKNNKQLAEIDVDKLSNLGYTQNEINTAFSWVYSKIYSGERIFVHDSTETNSQRFLHDVEQNVISPEAFGYLIQLKELGLLNNMDIDLIIDRVMVSSYNKVDLPDMKLMIASYLLDIDEMNNSNSRMMINANDTVH